jgi:hypothetical protein
MSNIILASSVTGAGTMTVQAPATSSNRVLTLEDANGTLAPLVSVTAQTASGTSVDFTGIPSWVRRITMNVVGLSFAAAGSSSVRVGSGSLVSTGYTWLQLTASNVSTTAVGTDTAGFGNFTTSVGAGSAIVYGQCVLTLVNPITNLWMSTGMAARPSDSLAQTWTGYIALSGVLDRVSLVAVSSTFDAGTINIMYE